MTRFARAEGSKSCNKKIPEDATPWSVLKSGMLFSKRKGVSPPVESESGNVQKPCSSNQNSWSVIEECNVKGEQLVPKGVKRNLDQSGGQGPSKKPVEPFLRGQNVWRIDDVGSKKQIKSKRSFPIEEIDKTVSKGASRIGRKDKKEKKCFQCMQVGHVLAMCPQKKECDICFICGSPEHRVKQCKQRKTGQSEYKYATCFICKEEGHISSCCPDNPSGLYPYGGGCRECGEVTHFVRDCPKLKKEKTSSQLTLPKINDDVEGLPTEKTCIVHKPYKKIKIVTF